MKTTAISKYNAAATRNSGRVGNIRYVQKNGETYVRSAVNSKVTNKRTSAQMIQRMKFASMVALCSAMKEYITGAFPGKEANQSYFNAFVQANQGLGVYRTKDEVLDKVIYALPLMIARGGLGTVSCTLSNGVAVSNINVGTLTISASTDVKTLSAAIVAGNKKWAYGDQLTILCAVQNGTDVNVKAVRIFLSKTDDSLLSAYGSFSVSGGCLAYAFASQGCIGFVHSNKTDASKSTMVASESQQTLINNLLSDTQYELCVSPKPLNPGNSFLSLSLINSRA